MTWITGSTNHKTINILDHTRSEQHMASMACMRTAHAKARNEPVESYARIACVLLTMDEEKETKMKCKFEI